MTSPVAVRRATPGARARLYPLLLLLCLACGAIDVRADRLYFSDGESITGVLVGIGEGKISWESAILGRLQIEQRYVRYIETGSRYDLETTGDEVSNCWMYVQGEVQHLHCDEGVQVSADWKLVVAAGEAVTEPPPLLTQKGGLVVALEDSSGNSNITKYNVEARSELRFIESRHTLALRYQEESAAGQTTRNLWRASYQYDQFFTDRWFATGIAFCEEDEFRQLDERTSAGLGMGYQFLETPYFDLSGKGTLNYVNERFSSGSARERPAFLWNLAFAWRINDRGMEFFHRHSLMQAFDQGDDFEILSTTGLKYPINGQFSSVVQLDYNFDNLPAESKVEKRDQKWSVGVNYDW